MTQTVSAGGVSVSVDTDATASEARSAIDRFGRARTWGTQRPQVSFAAAALMALGAAAVAVFLRRRAQASAGRVAFLLAIRGVGMAARPVAQRAAPFGGGGGALLLLALLVARARRSRGPSRLEELEARIAELQARADAQVPPSEQPQSRDVLLGVALALGLAALIGRRRSARHTS
jgi:hypothetical protein